MSSWSVSHTHEGHEDHDNHDVDEPGATFHSIVTFLLVVAFVSPIYSPPTPASWGALLVTDAACATDRPSCARIASLTLRASMGSPL
jgi:hypothetical protein